MATWVTHLMIADRVLEKVPWLDRRGFCVGNIAPDCNIENEDWTQFTPSREVTHWMSDDRKTTTDSERFYQEYIENRKQEINTKEEYSFLLGYYAHLITDAEFQSFTRDEKRIASAWKRIKEHPALSEKASGMPGTWDSIRLLISKDDRMKDIYTIEADYLQEHPESGYLTEIRGLSAFPDYIDYLPHGAIVRKIGAMGYLPKKETGKYPYLAMSKDEYWAFADRAVHSVEHHIFRSSYGQTTNQTP